MEILNTIGNLLTQENQTVMYIVRFPLLLLELSLVVLFFTYLLDIKATRKQKVLFTLSCFALGQLIKHFIPTPIDQVKLNIGMILLLVSFFKLTLSKTLLAYALPLILVAMLGFISQSSLQLIFGITNDEIKYLPLVNAMTLIYLNILLALVYIFIKKQNIKLAILSNTSSHSSMTPLTLTLVTRNQHNRITILYLFRILGMSFSHYNIR